MFGFAAGLLIGYAIAQLREASIDHELAREFWRAQEPLVDGEFARKFWRGASLEETSPHSKVFTKHGF